MLRAWKFCGPALSKGRWLLHVRRCVAPPNARMAQGTISTTVAQEAQEADATPLTADALFQELGLPAGQDIEKLVNVFYKLGKCPGARSHPAYPHLLRELSLVLPQTELKPFFAIMLSLVALEEKNEAIWQPLIDRAVQLQTEFGPVQLSLMLSTLGKANFTNIAHLDKLIAIISSRAINQVRVFPPQSIALLLQGFTDFKPMVRPYRGLVNSMMKYAIFKLDQFTDYDLTNVVAALVKLGVRDEAFFKQVAARASTLALAKAFQTDLLANMLYYYARGNIPSPQLFKVLGAVAKTKRDYNFFSLVRALWADPSLNLTSLVIPKILPFVCIPTMLGALAKRKASFSDETVQLLFMKFSGGYQIYPARLWVEMLANLNLFVPEHSSLVEAGDMLSARSLAAAQNNLLTAIIQDISLCNRDDICELLLVLAQIPSMVTRSQIKQVMFQAAEVKAFSEWRRKELAKACEVLEVFPSNRHNPVEKALRALHDKTFTWTDLVQLNDLLADTSDLSSQDIARLLIEFTKEFIFLQPKAMTALAQRVQSRPVLFTAEEVSALMQSAPQFSLFPPQLAQSLFKRASEIPADFTASQMTSSLRAMMEANFEIPYPLLKVWCAECEYHVKRLGTDDVANLLWVLARCNETEEDLLRELRKQVRVVHQDFTARQLVETLLVFAQNTDATTQEDRETNFALINAALDKSSQLDVVLMAGLTWACDKLNYPHMRPLKAKLRSIS